MQRNEFVSTYLKEDNELQRDKLELEYKQRNKRLSRKGKQISYDNQKEAATQIVEHYRNGKSAVLLVAQPGVGKTGCALETEYKLCTHPDDDICIDINNNINICGLSDRSWRDDYKGNMLESLAKHVYHRGEFKGKATVLTDLKHALITTDECHVASGKDMTISKELKKAKLLDIDHLEANNIKLLDISATPEGIMTDLHKWGDKAAIVILQPGPDYKGFQVMLDEHRIRNAPKLDSLASVRNLLYAFRDRYPVTKKYFLMRVEVPNAPRAIDGTVAAVPPVNPVQLIHQVCGELGWPCISHDSENPIDNVDDTMGNAPYEHTVILIKDYWRASKRIVKEHVGGTYEQSPKKRNTSTTSQGLTARFCNTYEYNGEWLDPNNRPIHYCDIGAIEEYLAWFQGGCNYHTSIYTSTKLKAKDGNVRSEMTKVHHTNITGELPEVEDINRIPQSNYEMSPTFPTRAAASEWARDNINWTGEWNSMTKQTVATNVTLYAADGQSPGNTHIRYRGSAHPVKTEEATRADGDLGKFGQGVRSLPVKVGNAICFIIVYKSVWRRQA
jgi:hypothetical protein